jgi:predicted Zn finger-like uncharacterized protein
VIIPCRQCHTRFKVPDGKVKARGLKVRCSRCGHTFRIYPDSESKQGGDPAPAAARPRGPDPFDAFAPEGTSDMEKTPERGMAVSALLAKLAPTPSEDDFDVDVSGVEPASTEPAWNFPPAPSRPGPVAAAAVALQEQPPEALAGPSAGAAAARSPVPVRPLPHADDPEPFPDDEPETSPHLPVEPAESRAPTSVRPLPPVSPSGLANLFEDQPEEEPRPPRLAERTELAAARTPADLPSGEDLASLAGFTPAWGLASPSRALSVDGILSRHTPSLAPAVEPVAPPPAPQFGGEGTVLDDLPSLEPEPLPAHGDIELDAGSSAPDWSGIGGATLGGNQIDLEPELPAMELDRRPAPEPAPAPAPEPPWALAPLSATSPPALDPPPPADLDWMPPTASAPQAPTPAPAAALGWDDPFSEPPPPPRPPPPPEAPATAPRPEAPNAVLLDEAPLPAPRSPDDFFEMPESSGARPPGQSGALLPDIPETVEPPPAPVLPTVAGRMPSIISKPPGRIRLGLQERELPGAARQVSAVILNVGLAGLLLLVVAGLVSSWATAGRVDGSALSPRRLLQTLQAGVGVTPVEVTPGTYETRSGRSLMYVRGRVQNRGAPSARVRVRAEVWDGAQAVKSGETLAGSIATPEELWRAVSPADVQALRARLVGAAKPVADGQVADFLVLLDDAPGDLSGLRLKVTATVER